MNQHSTKCLRESAAVMGFELFSIQQYVHNAIYWLTTKGKVTIEGDDEEGWSVFVEVKEPTEEFKSAMSCGDSLGEALCGAAFCFAPVEAL